MNDTIDIIDLTQSEQQRGQLPALLPIRLGRRGFLQRTAIIFAGGSSLFLAACGASDSKGSGSTVKMVEMAFEPATLTIKSGETVTWKNESTFVHTVTTNPESVHEPENVASPPTAPLLDSGNITLDQSWAHTFTVAGTYTYCCAPHELAGMQGTIVVEPA